MDEQQKYIIHMKPQFSFLERIDIPKLIDECKDNWYNQTLVKVNDCVVRLGIFKEGEFHFHKHDRKDEFFLVLQGSLEIDLVNDSVTLGPNQAYTVPKGVVHRLKVKDQTVVIMVEGAGIKPVGD